MPYSPLMTAQPSASRDPYLHQDVLAARTVFIAAKRADRPLDLERDPLDKPFVSRQNAAGDRRRAGCPFCAGNESLTPPDVLRVPAHSSVGDWHARIIPNRFPIVEDFSALLTDRSLDASAPRLAHGVHEVVIESATHEHSILAVEATRWCDVWNLCQRRLAMLAERSDLAWATVFKNSGRDSGASIEHLHSQLVALDFVPPVIAAEISAAQKTRQPFQDLLNHARDTGCVVAEVGDLVALVPPAPRQPFENWILPREPEPYFHLTSPERVRALATLTQLLVLKLERLVPGAAYNWWLHQAPFAKPPHKPAGNWHWHLEILPRLYDFAGFELATGCHVTTLSPRESARQLREA